ncbi:MAG: hypothetical protein WCI79_02470 [Candidatus Saccharibacteria bacterium]
MINLIFKIAGAILSVLLVIVAYGVISWNVFATPTFMSGGVDCMPKVNFYSQLDSAVSKSETASSLFRDGSLFGTYCATY